MGRALLLVDLQGFIPSRLALGRNCVNPDAPERAARLAESFRARDLPVIHVHNRDDVGPEMQEGGSDFAPLPVTAPQPGEAVFVKRTSSAFASNGLGGHLQAQGVDELVVCGAVAGFCVASTVRAGADLGFRMIVAQDAVLGFDLGPHSAEAVFSVTMTLFEADFAQVVTSESLIAA